MNITKQNEKFIQDTLNDVGFIVQKLVRSDAKSKIKKMRPDYMAVFKVEEHKNVYGICRYQYITQTRMYVLVRPRTEPGVRHIRGRLQTK